MKMIRFRDNLLAQFSVVTFVIMLILALVVALVLIEILDRNVELLKEHDAALRAGEPIRSSDRFSIPNLSRQVSSIKWITFGAIGGSFLYLYLTLVYIVWEGWRTIVRQRVELESSNAVLETRVAERVQDLKEALEQGRRRLDAFQTAAGRLALEDVPERALQRALQDVVDVSRDLVGARYGALAVFDPAGQAAGFVKSGFSAERQAKMDLLPKGLEDLGLVSGHAEQIEIGDEPRYLSVHGFSPDDAPGASFMGAPVKVKDRTAGALYFMGREGEPEFSPDDVRLLNLFALLTGVLLENVGLYDAVAQERRTLAAIQGSMTEGLLVLDPEGRVMYLNETAESLWGLRPPEAQGKPISEVLGPRASNFDPPEALQELLGIAARTNGSPATVEITVVSPLRMHLEVTAFPIPGGGPTVA